MIFKARWMNQVDSLDIYDLIRDKKTGLEDPVLGIETGFMPSSRLQEEWKEDHSLASEVKRYLGRPQYEK
jgi:hypothetical protein